MITLRKKLGTIASSLLLACSLALAGAALANSAQDGHNQADSAWGKAAMAGGDAAAGEPSPTPEPGVTDDSAWG